LPRRLAIKGSFTVIEPQQRRLHARAHTLGFPDLAGYLLARSQQDASLAQLASELDTHVEVVSRLLDQAGIRRSPRPARSTHQRRHSTDRRLTDRTIQLGFPSLQAYLADRVVQQAWSLARVASELGTDPATVRDRLDRYGLRRTRPTPAQQAGSRHAAQRNRTRGQARRAARLAALGFADLQGYLRVRRLQQGWPVRRVRAELRVDPAWLRQQMRELGIP